MKEIHKMTGVLKIKEVYRTENAGEQPVSTEECMISPEECRVRILTSIKIKED